MTTEYLQTTIGKFIFRVKTGYLYAEEGTWLAFDETAGTARVGLTDFRQQTSGDVAFVELPEPGVKVAVAEDLASIETIKVDLDVPAPIGGEIVAINEALKDEPEVINQDPYGAGWLVELRPDNWPAVGLVDAAAYLEAMTAQAEAEMGGER